MISQQLLDFIKQQQQSGKSKEEIVAALLAQSWQQADIDQGFNQAASGAPMPPGAELPKAGKILKEAWAIYKKHFKTFIGISLIPYVGWLIMAASLGLYLVLKKDNLPGPSPLFFISAILFIVAVIFIIIMSIWAAVAQLTIIRDEPENLNFKEAFKRSKSKIWPFFITGLLGGLAIFGGFILFIIPGIIFALWFSQYSYIVIEENLQNSEALKRSKYYVKNRLGKVFGKFFYIGIITLGVYAIVALIFFALGLNKQNHADVVTNLVSIFWTPLTLIYGYLLYKHLKTSRP